MALLAGMLGTIGLLFGLRGFAVTLAQILFHLFGSERGGPPPLV